MSVQWEGSAGEAKHETREVGKLKRREAKCRVHQQSVN
jgi:hypothetical protein